MGIKWFMIEKLCVLITKNMPEEIQKHWNRRKRFWRDKKEKGMRRRKSMRQRRRLGEKEIDF